MGFCKDHSVSFLKERGLNVIRHPSEGIKPLQLLGEFNGEIAIIGYVQDLVENPELAVPSVEVVAAADINAERTSKLSFRFGVNILQGILEAFGGNIEIATHYEGARTLQFNFRGVQKEIALPVPIGDYVMSGDVRWDQIILDKYLLGDGRLFVITEIAKSSKFSVASHKKDGVGFEVDVPAIEEVVEGNIDISYEKDQKNVVLFDGNQPLAFGFKAIEFAAIEDRGTDELKLDYRPVEAGSITMDTGNDGSNRATFEAGGAIRRLRFVSPEELGE